MNSDRIAHRITDLLKLTGVSDAQTIEELTDHFLSRIEEEIRLGVNSQQAVRETYQEIANLDTSHFKEEKKKQDKLGIFVFFLFFIGIPFYLFQSEPNQKIIKAPSEPIEAISLVNPPTGSPILEANLNISSEFGLRIHPLRRTKELHKGVDIRAIIETPVLSAGDGIVKEAGFKEKAGNCIVIEHEGGYITKYYHLSQLGITVNDKVVQGQEIGKVGNSGLSMMPHLHYEVLKNEVPVNPMEYIEP